MGGVSSIFMALFGVLWTVIAASSGGGLFALFGVIFIAIAVVQAIYNFKNATSKNRYSSFDITEHHEEPDPLNQRFGDYDNDISSADDGESNFCPYCGTKVQDGFNYCNKCGKRLP